MTDHQSELTATDRRRRFLRLAVFSIITVTVTLVVILPFLLGATRTWVLTHPQCSPRPMTPADFGLAYQDVTIPARWGISLQGFYIPGTLNATIIAPTPYASGKDGMLEEVSILAEHGYNVLTFESSACSPRGVSSLGYNEVQDIEDAVAYLRKNPDGLPTKPGPIALHGFSAAGGASTMAAARIPEVAALLTEGGYHHGSAISGLAMGSGWLEGLMGIGGQLAYRLGTGADPANLDPIGAISKIVPRPIFFVYGSNEISLAGAKLQLAAARAADPTIMTALWVVPGSNHGGYTGVVGNQEYARHVLPFYDCALLKHCEAWRATWAPW